MDTCVSQPPSLPFCLATQEGQGRSLPVTADSGNEVQSPGSMFLYNFVFLFLAVQGLHCCSWAFPLVAGGEGCSLVVAPATLIRAASLVGEHMLCGAWATRLWFPRARELGSVVVSRGLRSCGTWAQGSVAPCTSDLPK